MRKAMLIAVICLMSCATPGVDSLVQRGFEECRLEGFDRVRDLDVAIAIDTSRSTARPSGSDIDADGTTAEFRHSIMTDPDDSILVAQVAGVHSLLPLVRERDLELAIVGFSGPDEFQHRSSPPSFVAPPNAVVHTELTSDPVELEAGLAHVLKSGSRGTSDFSAAIRQSLGALRLATRRRVVLMISDSSQPLLPGPTASFYRSVGGIPTLDGIPKGPYLRSDPDVAAAAKRAIRSGVVIHTFGLGEAAEADPPHTLSLVAGATGGTYRAVTDPSRLHCALLSALIP